MELLWIILITGLAVALAYFCGGCIDRRAELRQELFDKRRRVQELEEIARFCKSFGLLLQEKQLAAPDQTEPIVRELCDYVLESDAQTLTPAEWELLSARLGGQEPPPTD